MTIFHPRKADVLQTAVVLSAAGHLVILLALSIWYTGRLNQNAITETIRIKEILVAKREKPVKPHTTETPPPSRKTTATATPAASHPSRAKNASEVMRTGARPLPSPGRSLPSPSLPPTRSRLPSPPPPVSPRTRTKFTDQAHPIPVAAVSEIQIARNPGPSAKSSPVKNRIKSFTGMVKVAAHSRTRAPSERQKSNGPKAVPSAPAFMTANFAPAAGGGESRARPSLFDGGPVPHEEGSKDFLPVHPKEVTSPDIPGTVTNMGKSLQAQAMPENSRDFLPVHPKDAPAPDIPGTVTDMGESLRAQSPPKNSMDSNGTVPARRVSLHHGPFAQEISGRIEQKSPNGSIMDFPAFLGTGPAERVGDREYPSMGMMSSRIQPRTQQGSFLVKFNSGIDGQDSGFGGKHSGGERNLSQGDAQKLRGKFKMAVWEKIARAKHYPRIARDRGYEGNPVVTFSLAPDGTLLDIELAIPSSHEILNRAALQTIRNAQPYPKFPGQLQLELMKFKLPISFVLE